MSDCGCYLGIRGPRCADYHDRANATERAMSNLGQTNIDLRVILLDLITALRALHTEVVTEVVDRDDRDTVLFTQSHCEGCSADEYELPWPCVTADLADRAEARMRETLWPHCSCGAVRLAPHTGTELAGVKHTRIRCGPCDTYGEWVDEDD